MRRILFVAAFAVTFSAGVLVTLAVQRWTAEADIAIMIARATTPADHEALASYFQRQAEENRAKAAFHARLGEVYNDSHPGWKLATHCEDMSRYFNQIAQQDSALATEHRALAKEVR